jgi:putative endonuclease
VIAVADANARPSPTEQRKDAEKRGHRGEFLATLALRLKGWRILARRHKTPLGEIDIIARRGGIVAFVEVKARRSMRSAIDAVTPAAKHRIRNAGDLWLARRSDAATLTLRYDIIAVVPRRWPVHIEDAF